MGENVMRGGRQGTNRYSRGLAILAMVLGALAATGAIGAGAGVAQAQQIDPKIYSEMKWRSIGPLRAGRTNGVTGVPGRPTEFYSGSVGGGLWKTDNTGRTWTPVFDAQPVQSIGAVAVAASQPDTVYVGTGEADMRSQISFGNGMYKSSDAGKTWTHIGLENTRQIGRVLVDPQNANVVFVAALGHVYEANPDRGVYRSTDGGATWEKILYKDENVGAIDLAMDPHDSKTIYASLWNTRRPPWSIYPPSYGPGSGVYKSTDGGDHWTQLTSGLPSERVGRIGLAIAPSNPNIVYAIVDAKEGGLYRSDDAGATWKRTSNEARTWGRGWYFCNAVVDPADAETVYISNTSVYRSRDGGKTWSAIRGAPGGDDYHQLWIYPTDGKRMILASDQGTVVTVDGAETWSSWYNQSTAEMYHVSPDYRFPYWALGAQQDSGAIGVPTRSEHSEISMHDWTGICAGGESGYTAPDPLHPNTLFGGTVERCNLVTGETRNVSPEIGRKGPFRHTWTLPLVFSEADPHALYFSNQYLYRTVDGGNSWSQISGDLTREDPGAPANLDEATAADAPKDKRRGVIYTIAPSPVASHANLVWVGTDDGLIHVTTDAGKTWSNVTPPELTPWSKVAMMQASHFDANEAYAAIDRHRLADNEPHIYRTRDGGKTWQKITDGLAPGVYMQTVKDDTKRKGLLFAGTETSVYVSFDDGDHWQSLQLNLPAVSMRDLAIHGDDLLVATHGRGFYVLDDITQLRQLTPEVAGADAHLFKPAEALRMHAGTDNASPMPRDEALADNPPTGALIDYYLKDAASGAVTIEILDGQGKLARKYSSEDKAQVVDPKRINVPAAWIPKVPQLSTAAGVHRWIWDMHYAAPPSGGRGGEYAFFFRGSGVAALPGTYTVKLTVGGKSYTQPLTVRMDPRIKTPLADLQKQFRLGTEIGQKQIEISETRRQVTSLREQIKKLREPASGNAAPNQALEEALASLDKKAEEVEGVPPAPTPTAGVPEAPKESGDLIYLSSDFATLGAAVNSGDGAPTVEATKAVAAAETTLAGIMAKWRVIVAHDLPAANAKLKTAGLSEITIQMAH
jgi:photosystem II stability/assembly factor-like uncharacterized protein